MAPSEHKYIGTGRGKKRSYNFTLWDQPKTGADYFKELLRVSKNQIVWGGNYFCTLLPVSQGWIVWDKDHCADRSFADAELAWTSFNRALRVFKFRWDGMIQGDMAHKEDRIHPTQKPVALYDWVLSRYAKPGDKILDTHVGSASSLIACEKAGLQYVGFEIDEEYYRMAKQRLDRESAQVTFWSAGETLKNVTFEGLED